MPLRTSGTQPSPWRTQTLLELAIVAYVGWHNDDPLHEALGDLPPAEYETRALTDALRD